MLSVRRLWEGAVRGVARQAADARVDDRRRRRAEGAQGKTRPPDVADKLPLELMVKACQIIGHSPIELEDVIKDSSIPQRMQNRHLVIRAEGRSWSS